MSLEVIAHHPETPNNHPHILFVHGSWHGAWCWDATFMPYFTEKGFTTHALSLRGHGGSPATKPMILNGIWDYVADVAEVAARIEAESGSPPILVGHSMGGLIVQKYLERHSVPAAVLVASIPVNGLIALNLRTLRRHPMQMLEVALTLSLYPLVRTPARAKMHFFSPDMPDAEVKRHQGRLGNESLRFNLDGMMLNRPNPKKVQKTRMLVLAGERDTLFTLKEEQATAEAYGADFRAFPMAHNMMLEAGWQAVADHIIQWLG